MDPKESVMTAGASFTSTSTLSPGPGLFSSCDKRFPAQSATVLLIFDHDAKYGFEVPAAFGEPLG